MKKFNIRSAKESDLENIKSLLGDCKLTTKGLSENLEHFLVGEIDNEICATVGLEVYGSYALLRSFAIQESNRKNGLGKLLYVSALDLAKKSGVQRIFLLTETAETYFKKMGFASMERSEAPDVIKATSEFRDICPASAAFLFLNLSKSPTLLKKVT